MKSATILTPYFLYLICYLFPPNILRLSKKFEIVLNSDKILRGVKEIAFFCMKLKVRLILFLILSY